MDLARVFRMSFYHNLYYSPMCKLTYLDGFRPLKSRLRVGCGPWVHMGLDGHWSSTRSSDLRVKRSCSALVFCFVCFVFCFWTYVFVSVFNEIPSCLKKKYISQRLHDRVHPTNTTNKLLIGPLRKKKVVNRALRTISLSAGFHSLSTVPFNSHHTQSLR